MQQDFKDSAEEGEVHAEHHLPVAGRLDISEIDAVRIFRLKLLQLEARIHSNQEAIADEWRADFMNFAETGFVLMTGALLANGMVVGASVCAASILALFYRQNGALRREFKIALDIGHEFDRRLQLEENPHEALKYLRERIYNSGLLFEGETEDMDITAYSSKRFIAHHGRIKEEDERTLLQRALHAGNYLSSRQAAKDGANFILGTWRSLKKSARRPDSLLLGVMGLALSAKIAIDYDAATARPRSWVKVKSPYPDRYDPEEVEKVRRSRLYYVRRAQEAALNHTLLMGFWTFEAVHFLKTAMSTAKADSVAPSSVLLMTAQVYTLLMSFGPVRESHQTLKDDLAVIEGLRARISQIYESMPVPDLAPAPSPSGDLA